VIGLLLSGLLAWLQSTFGLISLPSDVYFMDQVTIQIAAKDVLVISASIIVLALLSSILPAMQASRQSPAEALRDDE